MAKPCYTLLTRPNKVETAVYHFNSWLSVWTLSCRCPVAGAVPGFGEEGSENCSPIAKVDLLSESKACFTLCPSFQRDLFRFSET